MFGVKTPAPLHSPRSLRSAAYSGRLNGALCLGLGLASLALIQLAPLLLASSWTVLLLVGLPLAAAACFGFAIGFANLCTRLEITPEGLRLCAPSWRLYPTLPLQRLQVDWRELRAVRHRTERYRLGLPRLVFEIDVYLVQTDRGTALLGGYYLPEVETVLTDVAHRADGTWREDGTVELGLWATLFRGAVAWEVAPGRRLARQ